MGGHLVVTGASGYIGGAFVEAAARKGWQVVALGRSAVASVSSFSWRLGEPVPEEALRGATAVVHLAHDWSNDEASEGSANANFRGTMQLAEACRAAGCARFVFASTTSAHEQALNAYGRTKLATERSLLEFNRPEIVIARIGLVYGGRQSGLFGVLRRITGFSPVLPIVGSDVLLQPIRIDEVCEGLLRIAGGERLDRNRFVLAHPEPLPFGDCLRLLRRTSTGRRLLLFPVPIPVALILCDMTRFVPLLPTVSRERVYGLVAARPMESSNDLAALGLRLRGLQEGLLDTPRGRRRWLIAECTALLSYLGARTADGQTVRLLVRAVERSGKPDPLYLAGPLLRLPLLLRFVDPLPRREGTAFVQRLEMGLSLLSVAEPRGQPSWMRLVLHVLLECLALPLRVIAGMRK